MRTAFPPAFELDPMEPHIVAEDGGVVDWRAACPGALLAEDDEILAVDLATGDHYWACVHCRAIVRPAKSRAPAVPSLRLADS